MSPAGFTTGIGFPAGYHAHGHTRKDLAQCAQWLYRPVTSQTPWRPAWTTSHLKASVRASGKQISVHRGDLLLGGSAAPGILDSGFDDRQVETAARSTISAVQDVFAEELQTPWPAPSGRMPAPQARIDGGVLIAWFGSEEKPILSLAPLGLR